MTLTGNTRWRAAVLAAVAALSLALAGCNSGSASNPARLTNKMVAAATATDGLPAPGRSGHVA
ncbi:MAG: hypothetical protein ACRDTH_09855 [Pseudonocardiaceae bacterium]